MDLESRYKFAIKIARKLSEYQLDFNMTRNQIERKSDKSPVTEADKKSEAMFRQAVSDSFPEDVILGEEEGGGIDSTTRWVVDPIDGTRKFMRNLPFWGICIAFEIESEVSIGVVAVPGTGKIWSAMKGKGAYCDEKRIYVDESIKTLDESFITMPQRSCFINENFGKEFDAIQNTIEHDPGFLDAYSYAMLADGRINGVLSCADKWWDIAACVSIVEEAGGVFSDARGEKPNEGSLNIACSKTLHEPILNFLSFNP